MILICDDDCPALQPGFFYAIFLMSSMSIVLMSSMSSGRTTKNGLAGRPGCSAFLRRPMPGMSSAFFVFGLIV